MSLAPFMESDKELLLSHFTLENLQEAIYWINSSGKIVRVNDMACMMSGYSKEELIHMSILELNHTPELADFAAYWKKLKKETKLVYESKHRHKTGHEYEVEISGNFIQYRGEEYSCSIVRDVRKKKMDEQLLRLISEATSGLTEQDFMIELCKNVTKILGLRYSFVAECTDASKTKFRTISFVERDCALENIEYDVEGSPCSEMLKGESFFMPTGVQEKYFEAQGIEAYVGVPIISPSTGELLGHLAATDTRPVTAEVNQTATLKIFATRIATELERMRAQAELKVKNEELAIRLKEIEALKNQLQAENKYLQEEIKLNSNFDNIISKSQVFHKVLQLIEQVAPTDSTVLILGESGTGKELVARAIHNISNRSKRTLVKVNCAALPASLVESELFGHEKGAFTGALERKIGRFELADGGTIFLDEIGELPVELQAKLLRVLQEGEFERLGNPKTMRVNVRVIAATNRNLQLAIEKKEFREDLYYRLNVFPISCPPLRERKEDIPLLVMHFLRKFERKTGKKVSSVQAKVINALNCYDWPGNIRELENLIERAMILVSGDTLDFGDWVPKPVEKWNNDGVKTSQQKLQDVEKNHIIETLKKVNWKVSGEKGAAKILGLNPTTLEAKMKKLGIKRQT